MAITRQEYLAKKQLMKKLSEEGYPTYAELLDLFDVHLTADPKVIGYMIPDKGVIVLNKNLDIDQVSTIVRHEILHEYLSHQLRMRKHLGADAYDNRSPTIHQLINIAADYEISNRGYTEKDKKVSRALKLNGETLKGLVTEDDHPDWIDLTVEEMFDKLYKEYEKDAEAFKQLLDLIDKMNQQIDSEIEKAEQIEREANDISDQLPGSSDEDNPSSGDTEEKSEEEKAKEIADKAKKLSDEAKKVKDALNKKDDGQPGGEQHGDDDEVFDSSSTETKKEIAKVVKIQKALSELKDKLIKETDDKVQGERQELAKKKADKELKDYKANPITNFKISLLDLIKRQTSIIRGSSWSRPNRRYAGTGILAQGKAIKSNPIPLINVYFDVSGSVQPYVKTTRAALSVIKNFVDRGLVKVNLYYVSTKLSTNENDSTGGGADGYLIMDHIEQTRPTNVVVITDGDANGTFNRITVPGGVYFLIPNKDYIPDRLMEALRGAKANKVFYLTSRD